MVTNRSAYQEAGNQLAMRTTSVDPTTGLPTTGANAGTGTPSNVAGSASGVTILAANTSRLGACVFNDGSALLYLLLSASGPASATNYTVQVPPYSLYEVPSRYTGIVLGIWSAAAGNARVTEFTA